MSVLAIFYITLLSQIFLISYYYPRKFLRRITYVLANYPPSQYPKPYDYHAENAGRKSLRAYKYVNLFIILVGLVVLLAAALSGFSLDPKGGAEIFVLAFAMLQTIPHMSAEFSTCRYFKRMKEVNVSTTRKADLRPRHLSDFISPAYVALAVLLYAIWLVYYLYGYGFGTPWDGDVYIVLGTITGANLIIVATIFVHVSGATLNLHQAYKDQLRSIEIVVQVGVFVSILMSIFLITTNVVDTYGWEIFDPVLTSLYIQLVMVFGLGMRFRKTKIENIDFEVYKGDAQTTPT